MSRPLIGTIKRERVQVILDPATIAALDAARDGLSRSALIERAVLAWLEKIDRPRKKRSPPA